MELYLYRKQGEKIGCETGSSKISIIGKGLLRTGDTLWSESLVFLCRSVFFTGLIGISVFPDLRSNARNPAESGIKSRCT